MSYLAPFAGLKVVDLSQGIAGPYCAMLLAQYGADVIKVEQPGDGDWARALGVRYGQHSVFSVIGNLGKRSLALDLKSPHGKSVLWRLVNGADVFLEGFKPGTIARLGFGYEVVSARVPRILYLSISGFGQTGPLADRPAMDPVLQAYTGLMTENHGEDGIPHRVPVIVVDMSTALYAFQALSAALYARRDETHGRYIDASLMQSAAALQSIRMMATLLEGGSMKPGGVPGGVFKTADGWMSIVATSDRHWQAVCEALAAPEYAADSRFATREGRFANESELYAWLRPALGQRSSEQLSGRFVAAGVMHERLNSYAEFAEQPQVKAVDLLHWLAQAGFPTTVPVPALPGMAPPQNGTPRGTSPVVGQHSREILAEHGFATEEIDELIANGSVAA
jgi:crotonobetainyl-CoA:carnitine CoA-transferase CaiB-like acyl-CoA transferase